jgi:hypothetical protein
MNGNGSTERSAGSALAIGVLGSLFIAAATIGFGYDVTPSWFTALFRALLLFVALILVVGYTAIRHVLPLTRSTKKRIVIPLGPAQVQELQRMASSLRATSTQAKIFTAAILTPNSLRQRVTERCTPGQRTLKQSVTIEAQVPKSLFTDYTEHTTENPIYFPVAIPPKGDLHDSFVLKDASGDKVSVLAYSQYLQVAARVLRALLMRAYSTKDFNRLPAPVKAAEQRALLSVMQRRGITPVGGLLSSVQELTKLSGATNQGTLRMAALLVEKLSDNYALLAAVNCNVDQRLVLQYERTIIPEMKLATFQRGQRYSWLKDRLRIVLGARPVDLTVRLVNAETCQSYHLLFESAEGLYLTEQKMQVDMTRYLENQEPVLGVPPYYRFRRRLGQTYAHFYARYFPGPAKGEEPPSVRFTFDEVPPGSIFRATITSIAGTLLTWTVGYVISRKGSAGTDAPAFLLAFPAIAAAWLGFEAPSRRLLEATLPARLSLALTALTSIAGSGLFMVYKSGLHILRWHLPAHLTFLGITSASWAIVSAVALANAFFTLYVCLLRSWEFEYLSSRSRTEQTAAENG